MNKKTLSLTPEHFSEIIQVIQRGFLNHRPAPHIAACLVLEANLGLRISDIAGKLRLSDIIQDDTGSTSQSKKPEKSEYSRCR